MNEKEPEKLKPGSLVKLVPEYRKYRYWRYQTSRWVKTPKEALGQPLLLITTKDRIYGHYLEVLWGTKIYMCDPELIEKFEYK